MADGNTKPAPARPRVRSIEEARRALRVPTTSDPEALEFWGQPSGLRVEAYPVDDADQPYVLAEFAALLAVRRDRGRLVEVGRGDRLTLAELGNALWVMLGPLVRASDGSLTIGALTIGPVFDDQLSRPGDVALGITVDLLRVVSPARILSAATAQLRQNAHWIRIAERLGKGPVPEWQREALARIEGAHLRAYVGDDDQLRALACSYLWLCQSGQRRPLPILASWFGLTREQARDQIHRARSEKYQYLGPGTPGKARAEPGARLNWRSPE